jgi:hypothetical protein
VRFTVRRIMVSVAVAGLASLAALGVCREYASTDERIVILVASVVAGAFGLGAMRRPLVFLAPLLVVWLITPSVDHPGIDVINLSAGGCFLGWIIGAPVGCLSRYLMRPGNAIPGASEPSKPK